MTDRYQIISPIAACGCGTVSRGWDASQSRAVVITRFPVQGPALQEFTQNARKLYGLRHPNLVLVHDSGTDEEGGYLVTEMIKGESLEHAISQGALPEADFITFTRQLLEGLATAHEAGLLHLNLQPSNIILPWNAGNALLAKITDFNLVPSTGAQDPAQRAIHFMAPEQFGQAFIDPRTDLYVLGTVLYFALTQQRPFEGGDSSQVIVSHLYHRLVPLASLRPDLPPAMTAWVERLMSQDIKERPASAAEALRIFNAIVHQHQQETAFIATPILEAEEEDAAPVAVLAKDEEQEAAPAYEVEPDGAGAESDYLTESMVETPLPRRHAQPPAPGPPPVPKRKRTATTLIIATFGFIALAMFGMISYLKYSQRGDRAQRFAELSAEEKPEGSDLDTRILLDYLDDPATREAAAKILIKLRGGDYINDMLVNHLRVARQKSSCQRLTEIIGERKITAAFAEVLPLVHDHRNEVHKAAWSTLAKITEINNLPDLIEGIRHTAAREREMIADAVVSVIKNSKDRPRAAQIVQKAYQDPNGDVASRALLLDVIVRLGGASNLEIITTAISDPATPVRLSAITALAEYPTHDPLPAITARFPEETDAACRVYLILAATEIIDKPGPSTQEALALHAQSLYRNAKNTDEKQRALVAIGRVMAESTAAFYKDYAANGDPELRDEALSLARIFQAKLTKTIAVAPSSTTTLLPGESASYSPGGSLARDDGVLHSWDKETDWASWLVQIPQNGTYEVTIRQAHTGDNLGNYEILLAGQSLLAAVVKTKADNDFQGFIVGQVTIAQPGTYRLLLRPKTLPAGGDLFRVQSLGLKMR